MAIVRKTLDQIRAETPRIDQARILATTEDDIRRHEEEDDLGDDEASQISPVLDNLVRRARSTLGIAIEDLAVLTQIPVTNLRSWEQLKNIPDPAARSLLTILCLRPKETRSALLEAFGRPAA